MSTLLHDIPNNALLNQAVTPRVASSTVSTGAIDCISADGRCTAIQQVGTVGGTAPNLAGKFQESSDTSNWSDVSGAAFTAVAASDSTQAVSFDRTKRYLRYVGTITGTSPTIPLAVLFIEQKKQI